MKSHVRKAFCWRNGTRATPWTIAALAIASLMASPLVLGQLSPESALAETQTDQFTVFFGSNSSVLSPQGRITLERAAAAIEERGATRVMVTGHADAVGAEAYNLMLSMRRAQSVFNGLNALGVQSSLLFADWKGEYAPSARNLPVGPAPVNRRVVIELQFGK